MSIEPPFNSDVIRPGPPALLPGMVPGGVVIHVYAVPTCRLLVVRHAVTAAEVAQYAEADAARADAGLARDEAGVCLVAYDGDTGERMGWPGYATGDRL